MELSAPHGKDALRPGTMPGYSKKAAAATASDNCKRKRKKEPKAMTAQRLVDASRSMRTLAECERMIQVQLTNRLRDLGLPGRLFLEVSSTEAHNAGQSWEELEAAAKVASDEKAAAAAASDSCKPKQVAEPKATMAQRLADDSRSMRTLAECERMTAVQLTDRLRDLGLPGRLGSSWICSIFVATYAINRGRLPMTAFSGCCRPTAPSQDSKQPSFFMFASWSGFNNLRYPAHLSWADWPCTWRYRSARTAGWVT